MKTIESSVYRIMVPCVRNDGRPIRVRCHKVWDAKVQQITGGMTIHKPSIGKWKDDKTSINYIERMIPVEIACTKQQFAEIMKFTLNFYEQEAVFGYLISSEGYILEK